MRRELVRDVLLYLIVVAFLGTAANLLPGRHLAWWGIGRQPPREGTDFALLDPTSAEMLRLSLPKVVFLDTRTPAEYAVGHVPGGVPFDYTNLAAGLTSELDQRLRGADAVVLYGSSAETDVEQLAAQELRLRGLSPPFVLAGGFPGWEAAGLPVEGAEEEN